MARRNHVPQVRYISPFGSPAWMAEEEAWHYLAADDDLWLRLWEANALTEDQRRTGPPRIERPAHPQPRRRRA